MEIRGRTALVTGASGGIGAAIADALALQGASLRLTGRNVAELEQVSARTGGEVLPCDLANEGEVEALAAGCADCDILVANAGLPGSGDLFDFSAEEIDRALDVNLRAPIQLSRAIGEQMGERGAGQIVFMSSLLGKIATPGSSLYSATKFGLRGFAAGLRADLSRSGVGVSVIFPGFIRDAGMFHDSGTKLPSWVGTNTPAEVADAVCHAIRENRHETDVAPLMVRSTVWVAGAVPPLASRVMDRMGAGAVSGQLARGQRDKR